MGQELQIPSGIESDALPAQDVSAIDYGELWVFRKKARYDHLILFGEKTACRVDQAAPRLE